MPPEIYIHPVESPPVNYFSCGIAAGINYIPPTGLPALYAPDIIAREKDAERCGLKRNAETKRGTLVEEVECGVKTHIYYWKGT
jgi:hypothetical protein